MNEIRLKAYGFSMEAVGSKKFIAQEREAFLDFTESKKQGKRRTWRRFSNNNT